MKNLEEAGPYPQSVAEDWLRGRGRTVNLGDRGRGGRQVRLLEGTGGGGHSADRA